MALKNYCFISLLLFSLIVISSGDPLPQNEPDPDHGAPANAFGNPGNPHIRSPKHDPAPFSRTPVSHRKPVNKELPTYNKPVYEPKPKYRQPYQYPTTPVHRRPTHIPALRRPRHAPNVPVHGQPGWSTPVHPPPVNGNNAPVPPASPSPTNQLPINNPPPPQVYHSRV